MRLPSRPQAAAPEAAKPHPLRAATRKMAGSVLRHGVTGMTVAGFLTAGEMVYENGFVAGAVRSMNPVVADVLNGVGKFKKDTIESVVSFVIRNAVDLSKKR